jgi:hypothetical protein
MTMPRAKLFADPGFAIEASSASLPPQGLLDGLPEDVADKARWWERHLVEILTGLPTDSGPAAIPKPEYDIAATTVRQREPAKVTELKPMAGRSRSARCSGCGWPMKPRGSGDWSATSQSHPLTPSNPTRCLMINETASSKD